MSEKEKGETEEQYRQGMAGIIGKQGKFAMNAMVDLAEDYFQNRLKEILSVEKEVYPVGTTTKYRSIGYNACLKEIKQKGGIK